MSKPLAPERLLLLRAAHEMERRGHAKKTLQNAKGGVCLIEAIRIAADADFLANAAARTLVANYLGRNILECVAWNNAPERKASEVVGALRGAAMHGL